LQPGQISCPDLQFKCSKCDHVFEVMGGYAEREKAQACPNCGSTELKLAISLLSAKSPTSF